MEKEPLRVIFDDLDRYSPDLTITVNRDLTTEKARSSYRGGHYRLVSLRNGNNMVATNDNVQVNFDQFMRQFRDQIQSIIVDGRQIVICRTDIGDINAIQAGIFRWLATSCERLAGEQAEVWSSTNHGQRIRRQVENDQLVPLNRVAVA